MAGKDRTATHAVALQKALQQKPYAYGFYTALRLFECAYPDSPKIGRAPRPADEPLRLAQDPSLSFANATLAAFEPAHDGLSARLVQRFMGLFGCNGPLPLHLSEYARDRVRNHADPTFARFADVFHHRMVSSFYRAWANAQPTVSFDRPDEDRFGFYVGALFGIGMPALRDRDEMPDLAKLHYAGALACRSRHAQGLQAMLRDFFDMPSRIEQFIGEWLSLRGVDRWGLGRSPESGALGMTTILGSRVWDSQHKFRITLGPMGLTDYQGLLPGGNALKRLIAVVRNYVGDELDWDTKLILRQAEVPACKLGEDAQLGWTTWLGERKVDSLADDLVLNPLAR